MIKKIKFLKYCVLFLLMLAFTSNVWAASIDVSIENQDLVLKTPKMIKNTTFQRFEDIWIVFSDKNLKINLNKKDLEQFGVINLEKLITKNGTGLRFRFKGKAPKVYFEEDYVNRINTIKLSRKGKGHNTLNRIKFRVENQKNNSKIKNLFLDRVFLLDYAYSYQTGEQYIVAISNTEKLRYVTPQKYKRLLFLPTYTGAAIISEKGEFLNIVDENVLELSDSRDSSFVLNTNGKLESSLYSFFKETKVGLIERQLREYDFNFFDYKADGNYDKTMNRLNNTLKLVDSLNVIHNMQGKNLNKSSMKLEMISVDEEDVTFNTAQKENTKINKENSSKKEIDFDKVLVPDFSEYKLNFLLDKLLLSSLKQLNSKKKEAINIKRMQIEAFRGYFPEVIGLSELLRQDISGRFPKSNKGLALYTLASSVMKRCSDVALVPEIEGDYSSDIMLWKGYCKVEEKKYTDALKLYKDNFTKIKTYPNSLKSELLVNYAKALRSVDQYDESNKILQKIEQLAPEYFKSVIKYNMALNHLYQNESKMAEREFKELVFDENPLVRFPARLEYLGILLQKDIIEKQVIIDALEELRFDFRQNNTELEATKTLASIYMQSDSLRKAMDLYKYISIYYNGTPSGKEATELLFNIFYNLFANKQKTNSNLSDINRVAIFYDFMELTPSEYETSKVVLNVVDDLVKLGLSYKAIDLLDVQIKYKTKNKDVAQELGEVLAGLYLETGQIKNSIRILALTQKYGAFSQYTDKAKIIKAKIFLKQGKFEKAEKLLKTIDYKKESTYLLAKIYWENKNYQKVSKELKDVFLKEKISLDKDGVINLSYLMISSAILKDINSLEKIKEFYLPILRIVNLEYKLDFLMKIAGKTIDLTPQEKKEVDLWQKVIKADNQINDFLDNYNSNFNVAK